MYRVHIHQAWRVDVMAVFRRHQKYAHILLPFWHLNILEDSYSTWHVAVELWGFYCDPIIWAHISWPLPLWLSPQSERPGGQGVICATFRVSPMVDTRAVLSGMAVKRCMAIMWTLCPCALPLAISVDRRSRTDAWI